MNSVEQALLKELRYYQEELKRLRNYQYSFEQIKGSSLSILEAKKTAWNLAATRSPILICGENGTGKRLFAHAIHQDSPQKDGPIVIFNCQTNAEFIADKYISTGLDNSDSLSQMRSYLDPGTLIIHEISHLSPDQQDDIADFLGNSSVFAGEKNQVRRVIATISYDLSQTEPDSILSDKLLTLFSNSVISLSPLRSRLEDIPAICDYFIRSLNKFAGTMIKGVSDEGIEMLMQYSWPGNVTELKSIIERAGLDTQSGLIDTNNLYHLQERLQDSMSVPTLKQAAMRAEKETIIKAIKLSRGNKKLASEMLGITRTCLYNKIKELDIEI